MFSYESIKGHPIFEGLTKQNVTDLSRLLQFASHTYTKEEYIILEGDAVQQIGIIIHGTVLMEKSDPSGNNYFVTELREHEIFGEPFMGSYILNSSVNYKAMTSCYILFFDYQNIWKAGSAGNIALMQFTRNLINLLAVKTRTLLSKIELLSKKSLRDRILTFLYMVHEQEVALQGHVGAPNAGHSRKIPQKWSEISPTPKFMVFVPFNKTEMAKYLSVNRSALVRELSRMKEAQILYYQKNVFYVY